MVLKTLTLTLALALALALTLTLSLTIVLNTTWVSQVYVILGSVFLT